MLEIPPAQFSHGGTRNLLMREAHGARVALLTQDAEPADERWLERLLGGFELAAGRRHRLRALPATARRLAAPCASELERWFASLRPTAGRGWSGSVSTSAALPVARS